MLDKINPLTFLFGVELGRQDFKTSFIPVAELRGVQKGGGIKKTDGIRRQQKGARPEPVVVESDPDMKAIRDDDIIVTERIAPTHSRDKQPSELEVSTTRISSLKEVHDDGKDAKKSWFSKLRSSREYHDNSDPQGVIVEPINTSTFSRHRWWGRKTYEGGGIKKETRGGRFRMGIIAGFIAVFVVMILLSTTFASVTLTLTPRVEQRTIDGVVIALDISISEALVPQRVVPAEYLTFSRTASGEFEATAKQLVEEKARGKARIYNQFSSSPQTLVATTRFLTDSGALYRLPKQIRVPGAKIDNGEIVPQFIEVELVADKVGEGSNRSGELRLSIPGFKGSSKYEGFYGVAPSGFSGGFRGEASVVSDTDVAGAQEQVTKRVFDELQQEMARKIPPDFKLVDALSEIEITSVDSPSVGDRATRFSIQASAKAQVMVFRETDMFLLIRDVLFGSDTDEEIMPDVSNLKYQIRTIDFRRGGAELVVSGILKTKTAIREDELVERMIGQKEGSIVETLKKRDDISQFSIGLFPPWRSKAPHDLEKIRVVVQEPAT